MFDLDTLTKCLGPDDRAELVTRVLAAQAALPARASDDEIAAQLLADVDYEPDIDLLLELMAGGEVMHRPE